MAKNTSNIVGVDYSAVQLAADGPRHNVGLRTHGDDGHAYVYAVASEAIDADEVCVLTPSGFSMAPGAGDWTSVNALTTGDYGWFQETLIANIAAA